MTRLLQPPEGGWRGRFSFIQQILRSAFRVPDQADRRIRVALDDLDGGGGEGGDQAKPAIAVSDRPERDRQG
jgi:hypothetical protein